MKNKLGCQEDPLENESIPDPSSVYPLDRTAALVKFFALLAYNDILLRAIFSPQLKAITVPMKCYSVYGLVCTTYLI